MAKQVSPVQSEILNESITRDATTYIKVGLQRGETVMWVPAPNVIELGFVEDMNELLWNGTLQFWDPNAQLIKEFGFTGEEDLILGFGGNEDNRWDGKATASTIAGYDYQEAGGIATIFFDHPDHESINYAESKSYNDNISSIMNCILGELCLSETIQIVPTLNAGEYINPGMNKGQFIDYMKRIAVSTDGLASYEAFATKHNFQFVPRDQFNKGPITKTLTERMSHGNYRNTIIGTNITPYNGNFETMGITQRRAVGYDYAKGQEIRVDQNVDDIIPRKTFTGNYIPLSREHNQQPRKIEYTGLRKQEDVEGYVIGRSERNLERLQMMTIDIPGDVDMEPGKAIATEFETSDLDSPKESYLSGKWIIEKSEHRVTPAEGYTTRLHCVRNAIPDISDELLLKKAKTVKAT